METAQKYQTGAMRDCICLLALAFALRMLFVLGSPRILDTADAIHYIESARQLSLGNFFGFDPKIPVLYPALTALASKFILNHEAAACFVSFVSGCLVVLPVYLLSRDLHGRQSARLSGVIVALWPWLADFSNRVGPDMLAAVLWLTGVWLLARGIRRGGVYPVAAALAFFGLHLTRPEGTILLAAAPVAALVLVQRADRRQLLRLIPYVCVCGALLIAYTLYMRNVAGHAAVNYRAGRIVADFEFLEMAKTLLKTTTQVIPIMLGPVLLLFLGPGLFHRSPYTVGDAGKSRDIRLELFVLFYAFCQWFLSLFVLSAEPRYQMSVLISLSMWSALGMVVVSRNAAQLPFGRLLRLAPASALVGLMLLGTAASLGADRFGRQPSNPLEYKTAGIWMRENLEPGLIFSRKPQVGYYAGMPSTGPDLSDTLEKAVARARNVGARYVVVDERYTAQMAPGMAPLLDPALAPPGLRHIKSFDLYPRARVVVYELLKQEV